VTLLDCTKLARHHQLLRLARKRNLATPPVDKQPDGQISQNLSSPSRKNIPLHPDGQIRGITPPVSPDERGVAQRHERAVGCGGRDSCVRRTLPIADGEVVWF